MRKKSNVFHWICDIKKHDSRKIKKKMQHKKYEECHKNRYPSFFDWVSS